MARLQYFDAFGWYYCWCRDKKLFPQQVGFDRPSWVEYWSTKQTPMRPFYLGRIKVDRHTVAELVRRNLGIEPLNLSYEDAGELGSYMIQNMKISKATFEFSERTQTLFGKDPDYTAWVQKAMDDLKISEAPKEQTWEPEK